MSNAVEHPDHYNHGAMECWDETEVAFGIEAVFHFAICNAWKYRNRAPYKGNPEQDMAKSNEYVLKAKELKEKMEHEKTR